MRNRKFFIAFFNILCFLNALYFTAYSVDRACYPEDLGRFVQSTESISTSGNASKGEDMDACLEEVNKDSKVWQHGCMVAMDWLRIFRNLENLSKVLLQCECVFFKNGQTFFFVCLVAFVKISWRKVLTCIISS